MFLLDSFLIGGIRWALDKALAAAEAELNDDSALRDRLLEAEMQREMGEITDDEFVAIEADLLRAIREIKERREGGSGAFAFGGAQPIEADEHSSFQVEAEIAGDFYGEEDRSDRSGRSDRSDRSRSDRAQSQTPRSEIARTETSSRTGTARTNRTTRTKSTTRTK